MAFTLPPIPPSVDNKLILHQWLFEVVKKIETLLDELSAAAGLVIVDESSDTTCFPLFVTAPTGDLAAHTGDNFLFNSVTGDLVLGGSIATANRIKGTTRVTTTYTILVTDEVIFGNTDSAGYTATLPAGAEGRTFKIINSGSSGNTLTLAPAGSEHLIGVNSSFLLLDGESLDITYNATDGWY